jgi:transglutaminase-like putative cysteine protease
LIEHRLTVTPQPSHSHDLLAASGDAIQRVRFLGSTDQLTIEASSLVETISSAPLPDCFNGLEPPLPYPKGQLNSDLQGALAGWLPNGQHDPSAVELAQDALMGSNQQAIPFLQQLMEMIQDRVKYTQRHVGPAWPAGRTLRERVGSCRDLAWLMVECCRTVGLPARFVSGYHLADPAPDNYDLHAWAEVYLPGAGWRGFDPSAGQEINDRYIVLASSSKPVLTAAVSGTFSGPPGTTSELIWTIKATVIGGNPTPSLTTTAQAA